MNTHPKHNVPPPPHYEDDDHHHHRHHVHGFMYVCPSPCRSQSGSSSSSYDPLPSWSTTLYQEQVCPPSAATPPPSLHPAQSSRPTSSVARSSLSSLPSSSPALLHYTTTRTALSGSTSAPATNITDTATSTPVDTALESQHFSFFFFWGGGPSYNYSIMGPKTLF